MTTPCKGFTKERTHAGDSRTVHPCTFAAKQDGYCTHHHPTLRRTRLLARKRRLADQLAVVLTELIEVEGLCGEIGAGD